MLERSLSSKLHQLLTVSQGWRIAWIVGPKVNSLSLHPAQKEALEYYASRMSLLIFYLNRPRNPDDQDKIDKSQSFDSCDPTSSCMD